MTIRVLLVDDEAMIRTGLRMVLEAESDIEVVGEAADGAQAVTAAAALRPDVVLMDVRMPRLDGLAATQQILAANPAVKVVVLTTFNEDSYVRDALRLGASVVRDALRLGASGFLLKVAPPERLVDAIRVAANGDALIDPLVTRQVIAALAYNMRDPLAGDPPPALGQLTVREAEVLRMLVRGGRMPKSRLSWWSVMQR